MTQRLSICLSLMTLMPSGLPLFAADGEVSAAHIIISINGTVELMRKGWSSYASTTVGTLVRRGDLLRLDNGSEAKLVCADLSVRTLSTAIQQGVPCFEPKKPILRDPGSPLLIPTKGNISSLRIRFPRRTAIRTTRPIFGWTPVANAPVYEVEVRAYPDFQWKTKVRAATELKYPEWWPPLKPGFSYSLLVVGGNRRSDEEDLPDLGFRMLDANQIKNVASEEKRIKGLGLSDVITRFLLARLYAGYQLNSEAIEMLEELLKTTPEPACARFLGDLYSSVALARYAESRYLLALHQSTQADDREGSAIAHYSLGRVYLVLGNPVSAREHLSSAAYLYEKLGDQKRVSEISETIRRNQVAADVTQRGIPK
jgi:hypothetical protein